MSTDHFEPTPYPAGQHPLPREGALGRARIALIRLQGKTSLGQERAQKADAF